MAMQTIQSRVWTVEDVHALPVDGNRYECIDGELLVSPGPVMRHMRAQQALAFALTEYAEKTQRVGWVWTAPSDLILGPRTLVQPDIRVHHAGPKATPAERNAACLLIIEVLSPSTARFDRHQKRRLYMSGATALYWIIDLSSEIVEVWTPDAEQPLVARDVVSWHPKGASAPFTVDLPTLFADANAWPENM